MRQTRRLSIYNSTRFFSNIKSGPYLKLRYDKNLHMAHVDKSEHFRQTFRYDTNFINSTRPFRNFIDRYDRFRSDLVESYQPVVRTNQKIVSDGKKPNVYGYINC